MKNRISKSYITIFFLLATFITFAAGGPSDGSTEGVETIDAPAPIGDYIWVLALVGIALVFLTFRAAYKSKVQR